MENPEFSFEEIDYEDLLSEPRFKLIERILYLNDLIVKYHNKYVSYALYSP